MQVVADVGGIPGKDCNGFCKYCYFRKVKEVKSFEPVLIIIHSFAYELLYTSHTIRLFLYQSDL